MDENFRYKTNNYSFHFVLRQIKSGRMEIAPEFKDLKSWSAREKSQFIESLLLGIPTQPIWCEESAFGDYIVIEGSERLKALEEFTNGEYKLSSLKLRKEYTDCDFGSLPYHEKLTLEDRYNFTFIVINYDTSPQLKCEFFRRLLIDTGRRSDQSARNFAWRHSFECLQRLKEACSDLVEFAPRDSRWEIQPKTNRRSSEIDEVFLYLLMITLILSGEVYDDAYLDPSLSVDDLLDWTMRYFDDSLGRQADCFDKVIRSLSSIRKCFETRPRVILSLAPRVQYKSGDDLALTEFYIIFIRAFTHKLDQPINWNHARARRFQGFSSARKLISHVFESRND